MDASREEEHAGAGVVKLAPVVALDGFNSRSKLCGAQPRTDTVHNRVLAVDLLPDLEDAPLEFVYGKDLLLSWILCDCPTYMKRMHNWYKRACRLGLRSLGAPHHKDVFGLKGPQINDISFDFEDIQQMFRLSQLGIEMVRLWCM